MTSIATTRNTVKVCGLRDVRAAAVAAHAGADFLGFILAETRRKAPPELIVEVRRHLETIGEAPPLLVGVTVNRSAREIGDLVNQSRMDVVQLSGDESPELLDDVDIPVIKTLHIDDSMDVADLRQTADAWLDHPKPVTALLIDAKVTGHYGGTGAQTDWTLSALLAEHYPLVLAGGLKPGNVAEGISAVGPLGVDVSSGVEIDGVKDHALIESFVARARLSFEDRAKGFW